MLSVTRCTQSVEWLCKTSPMHAAPFIVLILILFPFLNAKFPDKDMDRRQIIKAWNLILKIKERKRKKKKKKKEKKGTVNLSQ